MANSNETQDQKHPVQSRQWIPQTILLLGTDASGKNHVAALWLRKLRQIGWPLVMRESSLCGGLVTQSSHDDKGWLSLVAERCFILCFPLLKWITPLVLAFLLHRDARKFKPGKEKLLVVSHSALRILAFYLGQNKRFMRQQTLPAWLERAIGKLQRASGATVFVLDVADDTRQRRIKERLKAGSIDPFDRFMAADSARSERIEACLVHLATHYYGAHLIENNDLSDEALWAAFKNGCQHAET